MKQNPFADMDFKKMMTDFKVPGVDMDSVLESQRRNIQALTNANQLAAEGVQAVARRQAEIMRETMSEVQKATQDLMSPGATPEQAVTKQTELAKSAFEQAISNMREVAEMMTKSQNEAVDVINRRISENLDEIKRMVQARKT